MRYLLHFVFNKQDDDQQLYINLAGWIIICLYKKTSLVIVCLKSHITINFTGLCFIFQDNLSYFSQIVFPLNRCRRHLWYCHETFEDQLAKQNNRFWHTKTRLWHITLSNRKVRYSICIHYNLLGEIRFKINSS